MEPDAEPEAQPHPSGSKWWRRRSTRVAGLVVIAFLLILSIGAIWATLSVRHALVSAQNDLRGARTDLLGGDAASAKQAFTDAGARFRGVDTGAAGFLLDKTAWLPVLGRSSRTILAVADAGGSAADAGGIVASAVADTPGGLGALAPSGGGFSTERIAPLAQAAARAETILATALTGVRNSPGSLLVGPVSSARTLMINELTSLGSELHSGTAILQGLPKFLGENGPQHYLLAAQDPAEQRGTGGVIGAYTILTIDKGRFSFAPFKPIQSLPIPKLSAVPPPSQEYAQNYDQFRGGERFWLGINLTPDFPTAAQEVLSAYKVVEGQSLDGVIFTDPFALKALLRVEGPAKIPDLGRRVTAGTVVQFVTNTAFGIYPNPNVRKQILGSVATAVVQGFINGPQASVADLKIVAHAVGEGHLLVYSTDPAMESGLRATGAGGVLPKPTGDFMSVIENSAGANKVDFYQDRSVSYTAVLGPDGTATGTTDIGLKNNAPTSGEPAYVIGPHPGFSKVGESVQLLSLYCGPLCELVSATRDGSAVKLEGGHELGDTFFRDYFGTPSLQTSDLTLNTSLVNVWDHQGSGGVYHLTFLGQTTVNPASVRIEVVVPDGMHITSASPSMQVSGSTAVWTSTDLKPATHRMTFTVAFSG